MDFGRLVAEAAAAPVAGWDSPDSTGAFGPETDRGRQAALASEPAAVRHVRPRTSATLRIVASEVVSIDLLRREEPARSPDRCRRAERGRLDARPEATAFVLPYEADPNLAQFGFLGRHHR